jgi:hypothetical protein
MICTDINSELKGQSYRIKRSADWSTVTNVSEELTQPPSGFRKYTSWIPIMETVGSSGT